MCHHPVSSSKWYKQIHWIVNTSSYVSAGLRFQTNHHSWRNGEMFGYYNGCVAFVTPRFVRNPILIYDSHHYSHQSSLECPYQTSPEARHWRVSMLKCRHDRYCPHLHLSDPHLCRLLQSCVDFVLATGRCLRRGYHGLYNCFPLNLYLQQAKGW